MDHTFCFTAAEPRAGSIDEVRITKIPFEGDIIFMFEFTDTSPFDQLFVNLFANFFAAFQRDDAKGTGRNRF